MGELQRHLNEQARQNAKRQQEVNHMQLEEMERSRKRSQDFIDIATQRGLGKTALYVKRSIIRPKRSTFFRPVDLSGRYPVNDLTYEYKYVDLGWVIYDGDESGPDNKIILPNNNVYRCSVPHPQAKAPKGIDHDPYVTTGISEHEELLPLQSPFYDRYKAGDDKYSLHALEAALRRTDG